ncbi:DNA repair ATPase [Streptomyces sp. RKND-216]|uniref:DNA repair ATPase n=1 Tax=Streptomyces sp. RKND-216 TaxID=2562581 RepID=UPI00109DAC15|nr:DNA repair ATPase [Streptomyces sp. RKND-216]THA26280.1 DNA repair ATPase [Streptomyces sp. RKND-216]
MDGRLQAGQGSGTAGTGPETDRDDTTYEVLRRRIAVAAAELSRRTTALNDRRTESFGAGRIVLGATHRIGTAVPCVLRDVAQVGGLLLTGGDPVAGGGEAGVEDVLALHRRTADGFEALPASALPGLLDDPAFRQDFAELQRFFRGARLLRLRRTGSRLLAVFRTGEGAGDVRVLHWRLPADGGAPRYVDARGDRADVAPAAVPSALAWTVAGRDAHVAGRHPHVSVDGVVFVSTEGGRLTLKTENDTETAAGVWSEPVEEPLQSLADADVRWARVGPLVLLRVRPYNESAYRHLVVNRRNGEVVRLDGTARTALRLPDDQGVLFPGGCYLASAPAGEAVREFPVPDGDWQVERSVAAPNGEDTLYVFREAGSDADGRPDAGGGALLVPYNRVRQEAGPPLAVRAWTLFEDGGLAVLRADADATAEGVRQHPAQVWRTPFAAEGHDDGARPVTGPLARVGNAELVRCVAECLDVARTAAHLPPGTDVFTDVAAACRQATDRFPWLPDEGLGGLHEPLADLREAADLIVSEQAREEEARARGEAALDSAEEDALGLTRRARGETPANSGQWVALLTGLRRARGEAEALRELRHTDPARVAALEESLDEALHEAGRRAVSRLARPEAFADTLAEVAGLEAEAAEAATAAAVAAPADALAAHVERLRTLTDVFEALEVGDATVRTALLGRFSEVNAALNRARAVADGRRRDLVEQEDREEFEAELALLGQALSGALTGAATPEACDEQLGALLVRVEGLSGRFGGLEERASQLDDRRTEIEDAFAARRQALLDERARRVERLAASVERGLETVVRRAAAMEDAEDVRAYFAADPMVSRVRATVEELRAAGDALRAAGFDGRLKAARQEALRGQRDRAELRDGAGTVRLGRHRFAVNEAPVALTLSPRDGAMCLAVTGTGYREDLPAEALAGTEEFWDQPLVSESPDVYRAEYLAATVLERLGGDPETSAALEAATDGDESHDRLLAAVREAAVAAHDEGYDRGVHDHDAARILAVLLEQRRTAGLLRFSPEVRAAAQLFWARGAEQEAREAWTVRGRSLGRARARFGDPSARAELSGELTAAVTGFLTDRLPATGSGAARWETAGGARLGAGAYLFEELAASDGDVPGPRFVTGGAARDLAAGFRDALGGEDSPAVKEFTEELRAVGDDLRAGYQLADSWLHAYASAHGADRSALAEAVALEVCGTALPRRDAASPQADPATGLLGVHPRVRQGLLPVRIDEFLARTEKFRTVRVPAHRAYRRRRDGLLAQARERLALERFQPRVQSGFVRNRLIDEVYLPLVGEALARQIGSAGVESPAGQGLLLLLSPPGYGKTTLMEYVASRLGMLFVAVDGPALGRHTTSLDPAAAPDGAARRELEKIDLALRLGDNVLLHLDDIQHTSPELLQKFIPLCDAQRRIDGADRRHDLRGKRFAVCMAGNPFTESGTRFRVPDMLANRADVWNLGDVVDGRADLFALSHVENALTSHPELAPLAARERSDLDLLLRMAEGDPAVRPDMLAHPYPADERERIVAVLRNLLTVRDTVLRVNAAYIASAGQAETARTEPPFLLQGSYRDTNRLAGRLAGVMNDEELERLLDDHYAAEAQALASGAEAALLKLAELRGRLSPEQRERWEHLKRATV